MSGFLVWICGVLATADVVITGGGPLGAAFAAIGALLVLFYVTQIVSVRRRRRRRRRLTWRTVADCRVRRGHL